MVLFQFRVMLHAREGASESHDTDGPQGRPRHGQATWIVVNWNIISRQGHLAHQAPEGVSALLEMGEPVIGRKGG